MKKIVRLTENDLVRLVKRVMNEQLMNIIKPQQSTQGGLNTYSDAQNTKLYKSYPKIVSMNRNLGNIKITVSDNNNKTDDYYFNCNNKDEMGKQFLSLNGHMMYRYYNKKFIDDLNKKYCATSYGGATVPNVGKYSSVDSNNPTNIA